MKAFIKHLRKDLTKGEILTATFSFIVGGLGFIYILLGIWKFAVNTLQPILSDILNNI